MTLSSGPLGASPLSMADLGQMAGAGNVIMEYLDARGIKAVATLALMAEDEASVVRNLVQPLLNGYQKGAVSLQVEAAEHPITKAVLVHMWSEATLWWQSRQAVAAGSPAAPGSSTSPTPPASTTTAITSDKVPKTLPPQVWSQLVSAYNNITLAGKPRKFPEMELIGAESVLARMYYEHTVTKHYTPVELGEILTKRSFQASGEVNPLSQKRDKTTVLSLEDDKLVQENDKSWSPRSVLSILDGLSSVRWAMILIHLSDEEQINEWHSWCVSKARSRPNKLEQFKLFWAAASWRICLQLRAGKTFKEAAHEVMSDSDLFNDHMSRELQKDPGAVAKPAGQKRKQPFGAGDDEQGRQHKPRMNYKGTKGSGKNPPSSWTKASNSSSWSPRWNKWQDSSQHRDGDERNSQQASR